MSAGGPRYFKIKSKGYSPDGLILRNIICEVMITKSRCVVMSWKAAD